MASRSVPQSATQEKWRKTNPYLLFDEKMMRCSLCVKYEEKLRSCKNFNFSFINGTDNFRKSTMEKHASSYMHEKALHLRDEEEAKKAGEKLVTNLNPSGPTAIGESLRKANLLQERDREYLERLFQVAYHLAVKGRPYSDFEDTL